MTHCTRPSTVRKVTRKTEEKRDAANDAGLSITLDGETYTVRFGDVTPEHRTSAAADDSASGSCRSFPRSRCPRSVRPVGGVHLGQSSCVNGERIPLTKIEVDYDAVFADDFDICRRHRR